MAAREPTASPEHGGANSGAEHEADPVGGTGHGPRPWVRLVARWIDFHVAWFALMPLFLLIGSINALVGLS
ncbi:MAG: hypothetical protein ACE5JM_07340, partial [Armatimonadota bacterium]